jgi:hypothetical protein
MLNVIPNLRLDEADKVTGSRIRSSFGRRCSVQIVPLRAPKREGEMLGGVEDEGIDPDFSGFVGLSFRF